MFPVRAKPVTKSFKITFPMPYIQGSEFANAVVYTGLFFVLEALFRAI